MLQYIGIPKEYNDGKNGTHPVRAIASNAFLNHTTIRSVYLHDGLVKIGGWAFRGTTALERIYYDIPALTGLSADSYLFSKAGNEKSGISLFCCLSRYLQS